MVSLATPPFSASSSWNTPISGNATFTSLDWPTSTGYNYSVAWDSYSPSVYVASSTDPIVQVTYPPGWGYPGGTVSVHMPAAANGAAGTDGELVVIDGDVAYNFWQFNRTSTTTASAASFGAENVVTGDGWGTKSPFLSAGTTAAGASELGGLLVKSETDDGSIDHALQLVVDSKLVKAGAIGSAISSDGSSATGIVQEGQLLAIPPGMAMPSGLSPLGQEVFTAMQKYGAYVVDVAGGTTNIRAQANAFDDATITALWHDMGKITPLLEGVTGSGTSNSGSTGVTTPPVITDPTGSSGGTGGTTVTTPPTGSTSTDTTKPTLAWVAASGAGITNGSGTVRAGGTVSLTLKFSEAVNVTGTPTLSLNDKGTAKYVSGAGTDTLQFSYTVGTGQNTGDLAISQFNLSGVKDLAGNALNLSGAPLQPAGTLVIDTTAPTTPPTGSTSTDTTKPTLAWVAASGAGITNGSGTVRAGGTVSLTLKFSEAVNVSGTPTLSLNDKGTAKYVSGSGTDTLQFSYTVGTGQNTGDLAISQFNLSGVKDLAGNALNLSGAPLQPAGTLVINTLTPTIDTPAITVPTSPGGSTGGTSTTSPPAGSTSTDTTKPTLAWVAANGSGLTKGSGTVGVGDTVSLTLKFSEAVNVTGMPTLSLNDKGTARYVSGSGTDTLQFSYMVGTGQNTGDLAISQFNLSGVKDLAGNALNLSGAPLQPAGTLVVDTTAPKVNWISTTGSGISNGSGTVHAGGTIRLSVNFNETVTVNGQPSLSLNSNGTAKYVSGSGTNTLQFDYKVTAGDKTSDLAVSKYNLGGVADQAGNAVNLSGAPLQPAGTLAVQTTSAVTTSLSKLAAGLTSSMTAFATPSTISSGSNQSASPTSSATLTASSSSFDSTSHMTELSFGNRRTLGYSSSHDGTGSAAPSDGAVASKLALLSQYSASSFATNPVTSTENSTQGHWGDSTHMLAKPHG